jgi:hypothetical protein
MEGEPSVLPVLAEQPNLGSELDSVSDPTPPCLRESHQIVRMQRLMCPLLVERIFAGPATKIQCSPVRVKPPPGWVENSDLVRDKVYFQMGFIGCVARG